MLVEFLEKRCLLSGSAYSLKVVSGTGFSAVGDGPSINNHGYIAFTATTSANKQNVYAVAPSGGVQKALMSSSLMFPGTGTAPTQTFGQDVIINDQNGVLAQRQLNAIVYTTPLASSKATAPFTYLEKWDATKPNSMTAAQVAMGDADDPIGGTLTFLAPKQGKVLPSPYNSAYGLSAVLAAGGGLGMNNEGQAAWPAFAGQANTLVMAAGPESAGLLDSVIATPAGRVSPKVADDGSIVVGYGGSLVLLSFDLRSQTVLATASTGFNNVGASPGISDDGKYVAFYAELTSAGAVAYDNTLDSSYAPLSPGPGIFLAEKTTTGAWVIQEAATANAEDGLSGFAPPTPVSVSVNHSSGSDVVTMAYLALDATGIEGLFTTSLTNGVSPASLTSPIPQLVAAVGQNLPGVGKITNLSINDAVSASGTLAFWAQSGTHQMIVKAIPIGVDLALTIGNQSTLNSAFRAPAATTLAISGVVPASAPNLIYYHELFGGEKIQITSTLRDEGAGTAVNGKISFEVFLSTSSNGTNPIPILQNASVPADLTPGTQQTFTLSATIPSSGLIAGGRYYVFEKVSPHAATAPDSVLQNDAATDFEFLGTASSDPTVGLAFTNGAYFSAMGDVFAGNGASPLSGQAFTANEENTVTSAYLDSEGNPTIGVGLLLSPTMNPVLASTLVAAVRSYDSAVKGDSAKIIQDLITEAKPLINRKAQTPQRISADSAASLFALAYPIYEKSAASQIGANWTILSRHPAETTAITDLIYTIGLFINPKIPGKSFKNMLAALQYRKGPDLPRAAFELINAVRYSQEANRTVREFEELLSATPLASL